MVTSLTGVESLVIPPRGRTYGFVRTRTGTFRQSGQTRPDGANISTTLNGRPSGPRKNTNGYWAGPGSCPTGALRRLPTFAAEVCSGTGSWRSRSLSTAAISAPAVKSMPRRTAASAWPTLLRDHVRVRRDCVDFDYPAKSGVRRTVSVQGSLIIRAVRSLLRTNRHPSPAGLPYRRRLARSASRRPQ